MHTHTYRKGTLEFKQAGLVIHHLDSPTFVCRISKSAGFPPKNRCKTCEVLSRNKTKRRCCK